MNTEITSSDGRVAIRRLRSDDADPVYEAIRESVAEVGPWMPDLAGVRSRDDVAEWIESTARAWDHAAAYAFAIVDVEDGAILGGTGLTTLNRSHRFANLFYWVRTSRLRQGIASTAALLTARFGLETLGLNRVEIVVAVDNHASLRVAEKVGAVREGLLRNRVFLHGTPHAAYMFSLIPQDLAAMPAPMTQRGRDLDR